MNGLTRRVLGSHGRFKHRQRAAHPTWLLKPASACFQKRRGQGDSVTSGGPLPREDYYRLYFTVAPVDRQLESRLRVRGSLRDSGIHCFLLILKELEAFSWAPERTTGPWHCPVDTLALSEGNMGRAERNWGGGWTGWGSRWGGKGQMGWGFSRVEVCGDDGAGKREGRDTLKVSWPGRWCGGRPAGSVLHVPSLRSL